MAETGPQIISGYDPGVHNKDLGGVVARLEKDKSWKDLSCVIATPAAGSIPTRVVAARESLIRPPNNRTTSLWAVGTEVGEAYSAMVQGILANPELSTWKYILCIEHDNAPPPDGLIKLARQMEDHPEYAAIGGLYFTKGYGGVPQIWGDPVDPVFNFRPQRPDPNGGLVECCGTGMGFTMFRIAMFKDERLRKPWFKTPSSREEGAWTQDLYFWADAHKFGYRAAIDCSVLVGHWDEANQIMW